MSALLVLIAGVFLDWQWRAYLAERAEYRREQRRDDDWDHEWLTK